MHRQPEGELHQVLAGEWRTAPVVEHCRKLFCRIQKTWR